MTSGRHLCEGDWHCVDRATRDLPATFEVQSLLLLRLIRPTTAIALSATLVSLASGLAFGLTSGLTTETAADSPPQRREGTGATRPGPWAGLGTGSYPAPAGAIYVSTKGSNSASGTAARPLRTISAAVRRARAGDTIVVHGGTYHESVTIDGARGITIQPAQRAKVWLDGSRVVSGFQRSGDAWVRTGWRVRFNHSPTYTWGEPDNTEENWTFVNPAYPMAAHPDQVWINGKRQLQVNSRDKVRRGRFYVDEAADRLYLGSDPTGRQVRASDIAKGISIRAADTVIRGIGVRRFAPSVPHMGAVTVEAPGVRLGNVVIRNTATTGLHVMRSNVVLNRVSLTRNGMLGMTATESDHLRMTRVRATYNNLERFNAAPAAGGAKLGRAVDMRVRSSQFSHNLATGLWFDESSWDVDVIDTRMEDNTGHGLSLEISGKAVVADNVIADNGRHGVKINDTNGVHLWNNTFRGNVRPINIVQDSRDVNSGGSYRNYDLPLTFRSENITVRNNIIAEPNVAGNCMLCVEDYTGRWTGAEMKVSTLGNVYQRRDRQSPTWAVVWSRGSDNPHIFQTIVAFREATGQERPGRLLDRTPALTAALRPTSTVKNLVPTIAQPLPSWLTNLLQLDTGGRHLGAFF